MKNLFNTQHVKGQIVFKLICIIIMLFIFGCKKYITVDTPATSVSMESAFETNGGAVQVVTGIYAKISFSINNGTLTSTSILPELSADNLTLYNPNATNYSDYFKNSLEPRYLTSNEQATYWVVIYRMLYGINTSIEKLTGNTKLNPNIAKRLLGEVYFMRALSYFYLINFYGEVPLVLSTAYDETGTLPKSSSSAVYTQIVADLQQAENMLDYTYVSGTIVGSTTERLRPNLAAVNALQARVYLYQKNYAASEIAATKVISQPAYTLNDLSSAFLKNSTETIWALQPVTIGYNTREGGRFILPPNGPGGFNNPVYASPSLVNSFDSGDARKSNWLGMLTVAGKDYYYPTKYKLGFDGSSTISTNLREYSIVLRLAEQYLIRAEARNEQNNIIGAVADLNMLRTRARAAATDLVPDPLPNLKNTLTQTQLRTIILKERRIELFAEWGHRWFDLRRSESLDEVMTAAAAAKGGIWASYKVFYPIPQYDMTRNPSLIQTPGYTN